MDREPSTGAYDYLFTFAVVFAVAAMALTLYLVRPSARFRRDRSPGHSVGWSLVALLVAVVFALIVLFAARGNGGGDQRRQPSAQAPAASEQPEDARENEPRAGRELEFRWPAALALGVVVLVAATGAVLVTRRRRSARPDGATEERLVEELGALLDDTLDDLRAEPDPRRAVVAAYARMERAFAAYGVARRPFEAPHEYLYRLTRVLGHALPAAGRLASELTHLYERAKFSAQEIDTAMKADAIGALEALRSELRPAAKAVA